ncbi:MAG: hypothetical protein KDA20_06590 [Phycisphaerales bacterium]|nr:hypothetical protein [Phycisphaerales bacterium]
MSLTQFAAMGLLVGAGAVGQQSSIVNTVHNLSASGPGAIRAATEEQVCIFCHAPHNASPVRPLWNRAMPADNYLIYTSRAFDAEPGQPTGMSKMCLSCHDGTIALGSVISRDDPILMSGGITSIPAGIAAHIGTDLRDDHPISFRYDSSLAAQDTRLRDPVTLPHEIRLDANGELQCTSCHDAHNNAFGNFLVMSNVGSQLCLACHQVGQTAVTAHQSCDSCHQPHTAPSGPYLLHQPTIAGTCLQCHDGSVPGAADIASSLESLSIHETHSQVDPDGDPVTHVSCADCHEPHTMLNGAGVAPAVHANFGAIDGVSASGSPLQTATTEYEVCFKCHADGAASMPWIGRLIAQNNTRLEFATGAVSFHPVQGPGRNQDVPSLLPGWTTSSVIYCSDCHNSSVAPLGGGLGARGVHGSAEEPLLAARYDTEDYTGESAQAYALCYRCHDRNSILGDESFSEHRKHIVGEDTPCAACHDAHGIASHQGTLMNNSHLINFATGIVLPNSQGRLEFIDDGLFAGTCYLQCHGENHSPERYPDD